MHDVFFWVTMEAEAAMTIHSQQCTQASLSRCTNASCVLVTNWWFTARFYSFEPVDETINLLMSLN